MNKQQIISFLRDEFNNLIGEFRGVETSGGKEKRLDFNYKMVNFRIGMTVVWLEFDKERFYIAFHDVRSGIKYGQDSFSNNFDHQELKKYIENNISLTLSQARELIK